MATVHLLLTHLTCIPFTSTSRLILMLTKSKAVIERILSNWSAYCAIDQMYALHTDMKFSSNLKFTLRLTLQKGISWSAMNGSFLLQICKQHTRISRYEHRLVPEGYLIISFAALLRTKVSYLFTFCFQKAAKHTLLSLALSLSLNLLHIAIVTYSPTIPDL